MRFQWDPAKATINRRKHGVSFEEAEQVLYHPLAITVGDVAHSRAEDREKTIGPSPRGPVLVVIHAMQSPESARIISARKADRREVLDYAEELKRRLAQ